MGQWSGLGSDFSLLAWSHGVVPGSGGVVYAVGGRGGEAVAVRLGGRDNVDESHVVWDGNIPGRFATPVLHDGHLYCYSNAVLSVYNSATGERVGQRRLSDEGPGVRGGPGEPGESDEPSRGAGAGRNGELGLRVADHRRW